jgi:hypothetical protein
VGITRGQAGIERKQIPGRDYFFFPEFREISQPILKRTSTEGGPYFVHRESGNTLRGISVYGEKIRR